MLLSNVEVFRASLHVSKARLLSDKPGSVRAIELHLCVVQAAIYFVRENLKMSKLGLEGAYVPQLRRDSLVLTKPKVKTQPD